MDRPKSNARRRAEQLYMLQGLQRVLDDPHGSLDVVLSATDEAAALQVPGERFDLDEFQATAVTNLQFPLWLRMLQVVVSDWT